MKRTLPLLLTLLASCTTPSASLQKMYADSLDERGGRAVKTLEPRYLENQAERRSKVWQYIVEEKLVTAEDYLYAGAILSTSSDPQDLVAAKLSGAKAGELGDDRGWRLAAEAIDRLLILQGMKQKYGTQVEYVEVLQKCRLYEVDPRTTDAERASMGVEPLAELRARAEKAHELIQ